jgi:hypothetical protein
MIFNIIPVTHSLLLISDKLPSLSDASHMVTANPSSGNVGQN